MTSLALLHRAFPQSRSRRRGARLSSRKSIRFFGPARPRGGAQRIADATKAPGHISAARPLASGGPAGFSARGGAADRGQGARRSAARTTTSASASIAVGWSLTMTMRGAGARPRSAPCSPPAAPAASCRSPSSRSASARGVQRPVDHLGHERLAERDRVALQDAAAIAAMRIRLAGAHPAERHRPWARAGRTASTSPGACCRAPRPPAPATGRRAGAARRCSG